jgi:hypothetical protein
LKGSKMALDGFAAFGAGADDFAAVIVECWRPLGRVVYC